MITVPMKVSVAQPRIKMSVATLNPELSMEIGAAYTFGRVDPYEGPYTVTPRLYDQGLATNGKFMSDDVTVYQIPISRVSNPQDGITVLIG